MEFFPRWLPSSVNPIHFPFKLKILFFLLIAIFILIITHHWWPTWTTSEPEAVSFHPCTNTVQPYLCALSSQILFRNKSMKKEKASISSSDHKQPQSCHCIVFCTAPLHTRYKLFSSYQHTTCPLLQAGTAAMRGQAPLPFFWKESLNLLFCGSQLAMQDPTQYIHKQNSCELLWSFTAMYILHNSKVTVIPQEWWAFKILFLK